jgi:hypothetical protein
MAATSEFFRHTSGEISISSHFLFFLNTHLRNDVRTELQAPGHRPPTYFKIQSLSLGEDLVHCAIRRRLAASR